MRTLTIPHSARWYSRTLPEQIEQYHAVVIAFWHELEDWGTHNHRLGSLNNRVNAVPWKCERARTPNAARWWREPSISESHYIPCHAIPYHRLTPTPTPTLIQLGEPIHSHYSQECVCVCCQLVWQTQHTLTQCLPNPSAIRRLLWPSWGITPTRVLVVHQCRPHSIWRQIGHSKWTHHSTTSRYIWLSLFVRMRTIMDDNWKGCIRHAWWQWAPRWPLDHQYNALQDTILSLLRPTLCLSAISIVLCAIALGPHLSDMTWKRPNTYGKRREKKGEL